MHDKIIMVKSIFSCYCYNVNNNNYIYGSIKKIYSWQEK